MSSKLCFGCFEVDLANGQLHKHGIRIRLRDQALQVLASLLEPRDKWSPATPSALPRRACHKSLPREN
jgi:hypothetical protein